MAVLNPIRFVIDNYPADQIEQMEAINNPEDAKAGVRLVPFSNVLYIEADDFMEDPPNKFFRLAPGREVRLRYGYFVRCTDVVKDDTGKVVELRGTYDPATSGGSATDGRKVKATLHWVSANHAVDGEVRLYDRLFTDPHPSSHEGREALEFLNPASLKVLRGAKLEPALGGAAPGEHLQFERLGYFCVDTASNRVFHRTVGLKDEWAKIQKRG